MNPWEEKPTRQICLRFCISNHLQPEHIPAARDYILSTILNNYEPDASILISTHLISDVENILDEVIFIQEGQLKLHASVEDIRMQEGESIDSYFREVFKC